VVSAATIIIAHGRQEGVGEIARLVVAHRPPAMHDRRLRVVGERDRELLANDMKRATLDPDRGD
jgi:hypothetical protein